MKRFTALVAASVLVASAACVRTTRDPATGRVDVDVESPTKVGEDWKGNINGQSNWTSISGQATARVAEGKTTATISISGAPAGAVFPWHVHEGKCATSGPIVGDPGAYAPLYVQPDGRAGATATVMARLDEAKFYHVNVHASPSDLATIVACGDIGD